LCLYGDSVFGRRQVWDIVDRVGAQGFDRCCSAVLDFARMLFCKSDAGSCFRRLERGRQRGKAALGHGCVRWSHWRCNNGIEARLYATGGLITFEKRREFAERRSDGSSLQTRGKVSLHGLAKSRHVDLRVLQRLGCEMISAVELPLFSNQRRSMCSSATAMAPVYNQS